MMNDGVKPSTKARRCRISRSKKRYWKKGTQIQDVEDFLCDAQADDVKGVKKKTDSLFIVDRKPDPRNHSLTRRQMAALMKRLKKVEPLEETKNLSKRQLKKMLLEKSKKQTAAKTKANLSGSTTTETQKLHDLWGDPQHSDKKFSSAEEYYLLTTKKKLPQEPKTLKHITSILRHVEVAPPGASYNPPVSKYLEYVTEAAEEEKRKMKESEKLENEFALLQKKYASQEELELELIAGLDENGDNSDEMEDENEIEQKDSGDKKPTVNRKTRKTRNMEHMERKRKKIENMSELQKKQMHLIYSARKLNKDIMKEMGKQTELAKKRKERKLMRRFTGTQRLGRGKFEPCEVPVLLTEELTGSLRELKPQGSILAERLKNLQKRNMLPIPGEMRQRRKLKNRLRVKEREDRKHQEVKLGTPLI